MAASGRYARGSVLSALILINLSSHTVSEARRYLRFHTIHLYSCGVNESTQRKTAHVQRTRPGSVEVENLQLTHYDYLLTVSNV